MPTRPLKVLVNEVSVTFETRGRPVAALDRISLTVAAGEFLCVVGPSGSGKSTLLRVLAGLLPQSAGEVYIAADRPGTPLTAMVFQEHALLPWRSVFDNVVFGPENRGVPRGEREARAREMLALVGLTRFAKHYPYQLSGGMKQRVGIARALANDPEVLLTARPGRVSQIFPVDLGRPRGLEVRASPAYGALLEKIWSQLREEVVRAMAEERESGRGASDS